MKPTPTKAIIYFRHLSKARHCNRQNGWHAHIKIEKKSTTPCMKCEDTRSTRVCPDCYSMGFVLAGYHYSAPLRRGRVFTSIDKLVAFARKYKTYRENTHINPLSVTIDYSGIFDIDIKS